MIETPETWTNGLGLRNILNSAMLYGKNPNMYIFSYDELMHQASEVIIKVSYALDAELNEDEVSKIKESLSLQNMTSELEQIAEGQRRNISSQLHRNHIADGQTGKWKKYLSEKQINKITKESTDFLKHFNYEI